MSNKLHKHHLNHHLVLFLYSLANLKAKNYICNQNELNKRIDYGYQSYSDRYFFFGDTQS